MNKEATKLANTFYLYKEIKNINFHLAERVSDLDNVETLFSKEDIKKIYNAYKNIYEVLEDNERFKD